MTRPRQIKKVNKHYHHHGSRRKLGKAAHRWNDDLKKEYRRDQNNAFDYGFGVHYPRWRRICDLQDELEKHYINRYMAEHDVNWSLFNDKDFEDWLTWLKYESPTVHQRILKGLEL